MCGHEEGCRNDEGVDGLLALRDFSILRLGSGPAVLRMM